MYLCDNKQFATAQARSHYRKLFRTTGTIATRAGCAGLR
jgi:hypothetical protein